MIQDPLFADTRPDLAQMRAALVHSPGLVQSFLALHRAWQATTDQLLSLTESDRLEVPAQINTSPEVAVHNIFRRQKNHFRELEDAAERFWAGQAPDRDEVYASLKARLRDGPRGDRAAGRGAGVAGNLAPV